MQSMTTPTMHVHMITWPVVLQLEYTYAEVQLYYVTDTCVLRMLYTCNTGVGYTLTLHI